MLLKSILWLTVNDRLSRRERNVSLRNSSPFDAGTKVVLEILHDIINDNKSIVKRVIIKSSKLFLRFVSFTIVYLRKNNYREINHGKISIDIVRSIVSRKSFHPFQFPRIPRTPKNPNPPVESDKLPGTSSSTVEKGWTCLKRVAPPPRIRRFAPLAINAFVTCGATNRKQRFPSCSPKLPTRASAR